MKENNFEYFGNVGSVRIKLSAVYRSVADDFVVQMEGGRRRSGNGGRSHVVRRKLLGVFIIFSLFVCQTGRRGRRRGR